MKWRRLFLSISLFLAVLIVTAELLRALWGDPYVPLISEKLDLFESRKDEWTVIFFGSSRVYRQISPRTFDRVLAERGIESTSLNLGIPAMRFVEMRAFIERVLEKEPAALRHVFIDPALFVSLMAEDNVRSERAIDWHDFASYRRALTTLYCCGARLTSEGRWQLIARHTESFLLRQFGVGYAAQFIDPSLPRQQRARWDEVRGVHRDGFVPLSADNEDPSTRRAEFLADLAGYRRQLRQARRSQEEATLDGPAAVLLEDLMRLVERHGAVPIFVLPPALNDQAPEILEAQERGIVDHVLVFSDPRASARLYAVKMRYDAGHLNRKGAVVFTRALARRFGQKLENGSIPGLPQKPEREPENEPESEPGAAGASGGDA